MEEYKDYAFCKKLECKYFNGKECEHERCCYDAKTFHQWLIENGYTIGRQHRRSNMKVSKIYQTLLKY